MMILVGLAEGALRIDLLALLSDVLLQNETFIYEKEQEKYQ